jgi:hypothetical protein
MTTPRLLLAAVTLCLAVPAVAANEIYRCQAPGAAVSYQQQPCEDRALGEIAPIAALYPDHTAERDRLMAREAAMDARLLKRLEIEAAERIARDNRAAMVALAERERAAREAQDAPVFVVGVPNRRPAARRPWSAAIR